MDKKFLYLLFLILNSALFAVKQSFQAVGTEDEQFVQSFVNFYEFNTAGRYAHEYHPYLLGHTAQSLDKLELKLTDSGFNLAGRMVITGYEGQAVPSYYTNLNDCSGSKIRDEAIIKGASGWVVEQHNRFGLMTGFLFKKINSVSQDRQKVCEHIAPEAVELFGERMSFFQEDAFGNGFPLMLQAEEALTKKVYAKDYLGLFDILATFWFELYRSAANSGDRQISGTQDILFTIEHARHLRRSKLPIFKYFTGGDITYPITISKRLDAAATINAQKFVARFTQELKPINNQATVYVFRSFVDGVGKSTMLGNIKNWMKHGSNVYAYSSVDNSSSQTAEVFKYAENVFIADLPAQMSHFTYKPDGWVYVDFGSLGMNEKKYHELFEYVQRERENLRNKTKQLLAQVKQIVSQDGWFASILNDEKQPEYAFCKNIYLLKKLYNHWLPFSYKGEHFLVNSLDLKDIRKLCPLQDASSSGLKNAQAEQMLFTLGVRLPLPYEYFLQDLQEKCSVNGIKQVVFVDFLSMYSRSSRENIRVNYLLQQLALLDDRFDMEKSLYKNFVSNSELFDLLRKKDQQRFVLDAFKQETIIRLILYRMMEENRSLSLGGISVQELTENLRQCAAQVTPAMLSYLDKLIPQKCATEFKALEMSCGLTKEFVNIQEFSFVDVLKYSVFIEDLFAHQIECKTYNQLWGNIGDMVDVTQPVMDGKLDVIVPVQGGLAMRALYVFSPECKNEVLLGGMMKTVRTHWYASLVNLLFSKSDVRGKICIEQPWSLVPPLVFKPGKNGKIYLLQKVLDPWIGEKPGISPRLNIVNSVKSSWGQFEEIPYLLDWQAKDTHSGLYGFGSNVLTLALYPNFDNTISYFLWEYQRKSGPEVVMPTPFVYQQFAKDQWMRFQMESLHKLAEENSKKVDPEKKEVIDKKKNQMFEGDVDQGGELHHCPDCERKKLFKVVSDEARPGTGLFIQAIATLEMIIKDPAADIVVRRENQEDFVAALKLLEQVVIPQYFFKVCTVPLFKNYEQVRPLV